MNGTVYKYVLAHVESVKVKSGHSILDDFDDGKCINVRYFLLSVLIDLPWINSIN